MAALHVAGCSEAGEVGTCVPETAASAEPCETEEPFPACGPLGQDGEAGGAALKCHVLKDSISESAQAGECVCLPQGWGAMRL